MAGLDGCGKLDISSMSYDNIVVIGNKVWVRAEVEEKIWIYDNAPCTVIKLGEACYARICNDLDPIPKGLLAAGNFMHVFMDNCCAGNQQPENPENPEENDPCSGGCSENPEDPCYKPGGCGDQGETPPEDQTEPEPGSSLGNGNERKARSVAECVNKQKLEPAKNNVDVRALNVYGWTNMAVIPSAAVIPMRSNNATYGPYASSNFGNSCGGTRVEVNTDLAPWVFGSIAGMNNAGQTIVESSAIGLNKAETGSITIPGMPISQFTKLGSVLGTGGATLSAMNFSYGSGGISTNYEFRTYTPKFGGLSRYLIDRIKDISRNRTEAIRFLRNQATLINKAGRQRNVFNAKLEKRDALFKAANDKNSLQRLFVAEMYDWQDTGQRTVLGTDKLSDSAAEMIYGFDKKAYASWDLFFGPISKYGDGGLPRYALYDTSCHLSSSDLPQPPYAIDENSGSAGSNPLASGLNQYNLPINRYYMDPLTNNFTENTHHHTGDGRGHVVDIVGRQTTVPENGLITNFYRLDDNNRYSQDYRFLGMRGPIVLHSWGYDTQGKPIPNEADVEGDTKSGKFKSTELKDAFIKDWLAKPATWPVAPIDLRFDRKRGVWVSPPGYKVVVAVLDENLKPYGTAKASLINKDKEHQLEFGPPLYNKDGEEVKATTDKESQAKIKVSDRLGRSYSTGTKMYCYYDTFKCEYIILESVAPTSVRFRIIDLCPNTPVEPDYGSPWTKYAGYGDKFPRNHILGIRINCEGDPINNKGEFINHQDISDAINEQNEDDNIEKRKAIFINLYDTSGEFGSAYAYYDTNGGQEAFNKWKTQAATGFGLICDPVAENTCILGERDTQCSTVHSSYPSYDIIFLDAYARFVECVLTQKLYANKDQVEELYPNDDYKKENPGGNAAATLESCYGDAGNGRLPRYYINDGGGLKEVDFRVFDPFETYGAESSPFGHLGPKDKVLAVFNENTKKYIIYQALKTNEKVIKFALVDNKDRSDRTSRAVLVDLEGYPINNNGERLTSENFGDNLIVVFDPFAIHGYSNPNPNYHNFVTTGFGPALGSEDFNEHITGIPLAAGDWTPPSLPGGGSTWKGGPFIGYAIQRKMSEGVSSAFNQYKLDNEIIFLESFAQIIKGKIASTSAKIESTYYYGTLAHKTNSVEGGFIDGRIPFTRDPIFSGAKVNLRVNFPLNQHAAGKYITGELWEDYPEGNPVKDVYRYTDGCNFIAKLDTISSKVNDNNTERLYYTIIEVENIANRGKTLIFKKESSDKLNLGEVKESTEPSDGIDSEYLDGFMWDKTHSKKRYESTIIYNRYDWTGNALIMKWKNDKHIKTSLAGYQPDGSIRYQVDYAGTIAQVGEYSIPANLAGRFGQPGALSNDDKKISKLNTPLFYHGWSPLSPNAELGNDDQPIVNVTTPWMTYHGAGVISLWNETKSHKIEDAEYRVVYAREAPTIITGIAAAQFRPENPIVSVQLNPPFASAPGSTQQPIVALLAKVDNSMGYGAEAGDYVTLQRVFLPQVVGDANYKYIVIGTNKPPDNCGS